MGHLVAVDFIWVPSILENPAVHSQEILIPDIGLLFLTAGPQSALLSKGFKKCLVYKDTIPYNSICPACFAS